MHGTALKASEGIQQVNADLANAEDVPPVAVDLLQINAIPDGVLTRLSPFNRYKITEAVIETVKRATRYNRAEAEPILAALEIVKESTKNTFSAGKLRFVLLNDPRVKANTGAYDLLDKKLMQLILKISRV